MSTATVMDTPAPETASGLMTTEEFLALPDNDDVERWLIRGRLIERDRPMFRRSFPHSRTEARIGQLLLNWLDQQPEPRGMVVSGEAGFRLSNMPASTVGIDVAYISAGQIQRTPKNAFLIEGAPILAVEILSPSDRNDDVTEKITEYLASGTLMIWRVEPALGIVTVFRPDAEPEGLNIHDQLSGDPHLPGFRVGVAEIFG